MYACVFVCFCMYVLMSVSECICLCVCVWGGVCGCVCRCVCVCACVCYQRAELYLDPTITSFSDYNIDDHVNMKFDAKLTLFNFNILMIHSRIHDI